MKAKNKLPLGPKSLKSRDHKNHSVSNAWYYEEKGGLTIVVSQTDKNNNYVRTEQFWLPKGQIKKYVERAN